MTKVLGGFLVGFFLAVLVMTLFVYIQVAPYSSEITFVYTTTHNEWFNSATSFLSQLKGFSGLPIVGGVANMAGQIGDFMQQAKNISGILYMVLQYSIPAIIGSVIMIIVGLVLASRPAKTQTIVKEVIREVPVHTSGKRGNVCSCGESLTKEDKFCPSCGKEVKKK